MKLYGNIKSERAEKGQGGNDYLEIEVTNSDRKSIAFIKVLPGEKAKIFVEVNNELGELSKEKPRIQCNCNDPLCAKCLLVNCKDPQCKTHSEEKKKEFREMYKNR